MTIGFVIDYIYLASIRFVFSPRFQVLLVGVMIYGIRLRT
jgi:hypothetical protein